MTEKECTVFSLWFGSSACMCLQEWKCKVRGTEEGNRNLQMQMLWSRHENKGSAAESEPNKGTSQTITANSASFTVNTPAFCCWVAWNLKSSAISSHAFHLSDSREWKQTAEERDTFSSAAQLLCPVGKWRPKWNTLDKKKPVCVCGEASPVGICFWKKNTMSQVHFAGHHWVGESFAIQELDCWVVVRNRFRLGSGLGSGGLPDICNTVVFTG